jgi:response regulator RpfG family c-di-GMP phosphodiesterase
MGAPAPGSPASATAVLFVDDEELVRTALGRIVRLEAFPAFFASDPCQALVLLHEHREIGVVVSDFQMPGMNGVELLTRLRQARPQAVRVLLTAHHDAAVLADAINSGAVFRYVAKPWSNEQLLQVVKDAIAQHDLVRENRRLRVITRRRNRQLAALNARLEAKVVERTRHLADANSRLREAALGVVRVLATASERTDPARAGHGERVARHAVAIGRRTGMGARDLDDLRMAATLLDIGTMAGPANVAPGPAADGADGHAERGARILEPLPFSPVVIAGVRHHHERWDGRGSPVGLKGSEIPKVARIVAVADAYVKLRSGDAGRARLEVADAQAELIRAAGRQFDPDVVAALVDALEDERRLAPAGATRGLVEAR